MLSKPHNVHIVKKIGGKITIIWRQLTRLSTNRLIALVPIIIIKFISVPLTWHVGQDYFGFDWLLIHGTVFLIGWRSETSESSPASQSRCTCVLSMVDAMDTAEHTVLTHLSPVYTAYIWWYLCSPVQEFVFGLDKVWIRQKLGNHNKLDTAENNIP